jgi:chaperonin GroEL
MSRHYESGTGLNQKILSGVNKLADNVASTLGPKGRNVILYQKGGTPIVTKDGVTVARFVEFDDPFENVGAQIIKQAAQNTNTNAGDGTTTSTVLAREILVQAQKYLATGVSPIELKRGMDKAVTEIVKNLDELSIPVSSLQDIKHIATISANGDEAIGELVATAIDLVGKDGSITIEESKSLTTTLDTVEGFRFDSGYFSKSFITDERRGAVVYEDPLILVTDHRIEQLEEVLPILEAVARENKPFIIVAEEVEGQALAALIMNTVRGSMKIAAIKAPRYGEERRSILKDLCISTGATFISRSSGKVLTETKLEHLGRAKKIDVIKNNTTIIDGESDWDEVERRIESLKEEIGQTDDIHECERLQERITRLASGVAIIRVGAASEVEMTEKKHRVEDALEAVRSAQQEGTVTGGGTALLRAAHKLKVATDNSEQELGVEIIKNSLAGPIRQMALNAGESPDLIMNQVLKAKNTRMGWNFSTGKMVNMYDSGIIDPKKVTRNAIENAASVSSTLLTTSYAIVEN